MQAIHDIASKLDIAGEHLVPYGAHMAKVSLDALAEARGRERPARLVLVSAMTPTPAGEGKTTTTIGLGDALSRLGERVCLALREPSLGPCMGIKGGGTGGGRARLTPSERINLHFTGDFHAISSAHNLLAAAIDNHLHFAAGKDSRLDGRSVLWPRVMDMNDRALRHLILGLGGKVNGVPREAGFDITAASELMAILCLANGFDDLRARINRTLIGFSSAGAPVKAEAMRVTGAMLALLRDAVMPNLVQTMEGTPALVHGGPFANIAHGCNSVLATRTALHLADWVVTEAGFGFDLGAEKFFHIKCRSAGFNPDAVVLVATVRALKLHGGQALANLDTPDPEAVSKGLPNLYKHIENVSLFKDKPIIALNRFTTDTDKEIDVVRAACAELGVQVAVCEHFARGGEGTLELARAVVQTTQTSAPPLRYLYDLSAPVADKIHAIATRVYGADDVSYTTSASRDLALIDRLGYSGLPVCIAKPPSSFSDDPKLLGRPKNFNITVRNIQINAGAGFLVVLTGDTMRMPGLPREPRAERIDLAADGTITGLE